MPQHFTPAEWQKINAEFNTSAANYGLPARRSDSVIIGSFNIRKLGDINKRTDESWQLFKNTLERFDLIAIQEVMDNSEGLYHLKELLGEALQDSHIRQHRSSTWQTWQWGIAGIFIQQQTDRANRSCQ